MDGGSSDPRDRDLQDLASRWPYVPRAADHAALQRSRDGGSVLLVGEPGIGKTALAGRVLEARRAGGAHVEELVGSEHRRELALGALRCDIPSPEELPSAQLLRWALHLLVERAGGSALVLGVDDAHHLDPVSAALVHQLVTTGQATTVITARAGVALPDAIERLEAGGLIRRTALGPLEHDDVGPLLHGVLGAPATTSTIHALTAASGGNPLHLRELCAHGIDRRLLRRRSGSWIWDGPVQAGDGLRRLLAERIAGLDERSARALDLLAFADVLGIDMCEALVGVDVVDRLERRRLIVVQGTGRREEVRLAHPLFGEVIRDDRRDRAASVYATLADAVETRGCRRASDASRVAEWRLEAGRSVEPAQLLVAADHASSSHDHARAERLARAALAAGGGATAEITLGAVLAEADRVHEAEQVWASINLAPGEPLQVQLDIVRAINLFFGLDRPGAAAALLDDAQDGATTTAEREQVQVKRAALRFYEGRPTSARIASAPIVERSASAHRRRTAAVFLGPSLAMEGRCDEALAVLDRALEETTAESSLNVTGELLAGRFLALALGGRLAESCAQARDLQSLSATLGIDKGVAVFGLAVGHASLQLGQVGQAIVALEDAAVLLREHDRNRYLPWCLGELAHARTLAGDPDGAADALAEADRSRWAAFHLFDCRLDIAGARLATVDGRIAEAGQLALSAARQAAGRGQAVFAAQALHEWARASSGARRPPTGPLMDVLTAAAENPLVSSYLAHADAVQRDDAVALASVAARLGALGARVHEAESLKLASDAHLRAGSPARALGCALAALAAAGTCEGAADDWLGTLPALELLSNRELEVARRTAAGTPSRALAEELFVSIRTVENHLHRIYAKLSLPGREELAAALNEMTDASEWRVAHDLAEGPSYVPPHPLPLEVEWLTSS